MQFKTQRLQSDYESEKKKRVRKEEDLKDAEEQIIKLQEDLRMMEGMLERSSKRALPLRGKDDSPEMLPSRKKHIVEVKANAAAIINQKEDVISLEPELRLDSQGDLVSDEVALPVAPMSERDRVSEQCRQIVVERRKAKLKEAERIAAASVESERIRQEGVEARRKAARDADKASDIGKSPLPQKYLGLGKAAQENFHSKMGPYKGYNRRISPTPDHFKDYNAARDAHLSDGQLSAMSLEAWRSHLRKMHEYLPDRDIPKSVHLDHIKILSAAITDYKRQRTTLNLWGESAVAFKHERYAQMGVKYHIPAEVCTPKELMRSVEQREMNTLYRKRCCQINKFYSMLLKDTPGYIPAPDYKGKGKGSQSRKTGPKPAPPIRKNPAFNPMAGGADTNQWMGPPPKLDVLVPRSRVDPITENLSSRHEKNMHRDMKKDKRFNPIAGEEAGYSSESGNEREDYENSHYDSRMVPADKKDLATLEWKIRSIKTSDLPKEFTEMRQNALRKAQTEFEKSGVIPAYLSGVKSPWDIGTGLSYVRYNEWILAELERKISLLRVRNAQTCALEDASKNLDGPMGQGRR